MEVVQELWATVTAEPRWVTVAGLCLDALGALVIVFSVVVSRRGAATIEGVRAPDETRLSLWSADTCPYQ